MNHKIARILSALIFVALLITSLGAQQPPATTAQQSADDRIALYQALLDLTNPWTVMCVAAHPDDEDGTSLTVMRHKYGAHTVSLFSTFGEGGQNAIGPELYEELGAIRARETMAAAEIQGSEPYFLGLKDFGFSKTRDEAFKFWGHDEALRRMVLQIRKLRPDVIITNHSTTSNDHGHHQATAVLVVEAFDAAADPSRFPEQLKDVDTWQVQRLFVRQRGNQAPAADVQIVTIDPNERDPVRGTLFAEQALMALQKHATQGPWPKTFAEFAARFRAFSGQGGTTGQVPMIRYRLEREAKGASALPKDSHSFLAGLPIAGVIGTAAVDADGLTSLIDKRDELLQRLASINKQIEDEVLNAPVDKTPTATASRSHLTGNLVRVQRAMATAKGFRGRLIGTDLVPGAVSRFSLEISNSDAREARVEAKLYAVEQGVEPARFFDNQPLVTMVPAGRTANVQLNFQTPLGLALTVPNSEHLSQGFGPGVRFLASADVKVNGTIYGLTPSTILDVVPAIEIRRVAPVPLVITRQTGARRQAITATIVNHMQKQALSAIEVVERLNRTNSVEKRVAESVVSLKSGEAREITISTTLVGEPSNLLIRTATGSSNEVRIPVVIANANIGSDLRVGYIRGFDFSLPNALNALGVESKELGVEDVKTADLSQFTSVIVDNRVYESKPELIAVNQRLLDYANAGGNLIVFYHKNDEWNPDERRNRPQLAPYKLILGGERITDENAPISFLEPDHPLLNTPNKLGQDDFKDWIQERGLYYPKEWDPQFHALLQSNDPGEAPLKGGLLVADYGRGHYIYTSMVWYRELRAGVPGAYRMLANMISYGKK